MHSYNIMLRLQMIAPPPPPAASAPGTGDGRFDAPQVQVIGWEAAELQKQKNLKSSSGSSLNSSQATSDLLPRPHILHKFPDMLRTHLER